MPEIFKNLWVKLAAIILAILLWVHVATNKVYQKEVTIPLSQIEFSGKLVLVEPPPESVKVIVSTIGKRLLRTDWKRKGLKLVVNRTTPGKFKADVTVGTITLAKSEKVDIVEVVSPREIELNCDRRLEKKVPARSQLIVLPGEGFTVSKRDSLLPAMITVSGPWEKISTLDHISIRKETFENVRNNFSVKEHLELPYIYGMKAFPDTVAVFITVTPIKTRVFADLIIKLKNIPPGKSYDIIPAKIELRVSGSPGIIDTLSSGTLSAIADYSLVDGRGIVPIEVICPPSIFIVRRSVDSIRVFIK
ncbi:MAG: hypothetical protein NTV06_03725 [candidate division Zixibacteria bacterium]|nr:hypothetical protein [candidate division Zixibacteria bacterium]